MARYDIPKFQTDEKGFQEWIRFELNDYRAIQKLLKSGELEVNWTDERKPVIKTSDSLVKNEIIRVFDKMPIGFYTYFEWEDISGKDTIFVDETKKEFYRFLIPYQEINFKFALTDSLTYKFEGKNFSDTIQITGGQIGSPIFEKYHSFDRTDPSDEISTWLKKTVLERFSLRKILKLLALKELDIIVLTSFSTKLKIEAKTKRAKRLGRKLDVMFQKKWHTWRYKSSFASEFKMRLKPDLGVWQYDYRTIETD